MMGFTDFTRVTADISFCKKSCSDLFLLSCQVSSRVGHTGTWARFCVLCCQVAVKMGPCPVVPTQPVSSVRSSPPVQRHTPCNSAMHVRLPIPDGIGSCGQ